MCGRIIMFYCPATLAHSPRSHDMGGPHPVLYTVPVPPMVHRNRVPPNVYCQSCFRDDVMFVIPLPVLGTPCATAARVPASGLGGEFCIKTRGCFLFEDDVSLFHTVPFIVYLFGLRIEFSP